MAADLGDSDQDEEAVCVPEEVDSPVPRCLRPLRGLRAQGEMAGMLTETAWRRLRFGKVLGKGSFGTVFKARVAGSRDVFAVKSLHLGASAGNCSVDTEFGILCRLSHPNVVALRGAFRDQECFYFVLELCDGGTLAHKVKHFWDGTDVPGVKDDGGRGLPAGMVIRHVWQMLAGAVYLHHHRFVHRDIKPNNYMFDTCSDASPLRLIDFGSACVYAKGVPMAKRVGTLHYAAPEVFSGSFSEKCDVWSIGASTFYSCVAYHPICGATEQETLAMVRRGQREFKPRDWKWLPPKVKSLVEELMTVSPELRPSAKAVASAHEWLNKRTLWAEAPCCALV